jgi:hypothetical protein
MVTMNAGTLKNFLRWNEGRSFLWQVLGAIGVWAYIVALHWNNDGLWYQGDAPRHAANGIFWWDFLSSFPVNPVEFALSYYARYPVVNPTAYPPAFYLLEGAAYRLFGISPFIAKGLVLTFALVGTLYLITWLRRWVSEGTGWAGILLVLQPAIIIWGHAVMLNIPSMVFGIAALYHWRRWLEDPPSRHLYLASAFCLLAVLTYPSMAVVVLLMLGLALIKGKARALIHRRTLMVIGFSVAVLIPWAILQWTWAPMHRAAGFYLGDYPFWKLTSWTFYLELIPKLVTIPLLFAALGGIIVGIWNNRFREEVIFSVMWLAICYVWFSAFAVKEPRYVLLLIPPIICLGALGITGGLQWSTDRLGQKTSRLIFPALMFLLGLHLWAAPSIHVPRVTGFQEIVSYMRTIAPAQRVLYDGIYNGVFSFYLRADDEQFTRGVELGSKLFYATKLEAQYGLVEMVSSPIEVVERFKNMCGCKWLVVERQTGEIQAAKHLRTALTGGEFRLVRSFRVETLNVTDVDVYEYLGVISVPFQVELPFPILGDEVKALAKPIDR